MKEQLALVPRNGRPSTGHIASSERWEREIESPESTRVPSSSKFPVLVILSVVPQHQSRLLALMSHSDCNMC